MADEKVDQKVGEKKPKKSSPKVTLTSKSVESKDSAVLSKSPNGSPKFKNTKNGQFRTKPTRKTRGDDTFPSSPKTNAGINIDSDEKPILWGAAILKKKAEVNKDSLNLKGEISFSVYDTDLFQGKIRVNAASIGLGLSVEKNRVGVDAQASGPSVKYVPDPATICIGPSTSLRLEGTLTIGVGARYTWGRFFQKNKSNNGWRIGYEVGGGEGFSWSNSFDLSLDPDDQNCLPQFEENTQFPNPQPNKLPPKDKEEMSPDPAADNKPTQGRGPASVPNSNNFPEETSNSVAENNMREAIADRLRESGIAEEDITNFFESFTNKENSETLTKIYENITSSPTSSKTTSSTQEEDLQGYSQACDFLEKLGKQLGSDALMKCGGIGKHLVEGYKICSSLSSDLSKGFAVGLGSFANLAGVFMGIIGLFFGGPDPTKIILDAIEKLSDQIKTLDTDMKNNFRQQAIQQEIFYKHIMAHLRTLSIELQNGINSIRIDVRRGFNQLESRLDFMTALLGKNQQASLLQSLESTCTDAERLQSQNSSSLSSKNTADLMAQLYSHIISLSVNPLLNGYNLWSTFNDKNHPAEIILDAFNFDVEKLGSEDKIDFNQLLDFFQKYAFWQTREDSTEKSYYSSDKKLPNPVVINRALQSYLSLKYFSCSFEKESEEKDLEEIKKVVHETIEFLEYLSTDEILFKSLLKDYYESLEKIQQVIRDYALDKSEELYDSMNKEYLLKETEKTKLGLACQEEIEFDLLEDNPEVFISKFNQRRLNYIEGEVGEKDTVEHDVVHFTKRRIYQETDASKSSPLAVLLAGEYLQLWKFTAEQSKPVEGRKWNKKYYKPAPDSCQDTSFGWRTLNLLHGEEVQLEQEKWNNKYWLVAADATKFSVDVDKWRTTFPNPSHKTGFHRKELYLTEWQQCHRADIFPEHTMLDASWVASYDLKIEGRSIVTLQFQEDWKYAPPISVEIDWDPQSPSLRRYNEVNLISFTDADKEKGYNRFENELLKCIFDRFNSDAKTIECKIIFPEDAQFLNLCRLGVTTKLFEKRKEIASTLKEGKSEGKGQDSVDAFKTATKKLDKAVMFLRFYAFLAGKPLNTDSFDNLITSHTILKELEAFSDLNDVDFNRQLCPTLYRTLIERDREEDTFVQTVIKLRHENSSQLPPNHPRKVLEVAQRKLALFQVWRKLHAKVAPGNAEEGELKRIIKSPARHLASVIQEIDSSSYQMARFTVSKHFIYSSQMSGKLYTNTFDACMRFLLEEVSKSACVGIDFSRPYDLDDSETQEWLSRAFRREPGIGRWPFYIGFLVNYIQQENILTEEDLVSPQPLNLAFWLDGVRTFLTFILDERVEKTGIEAGYDIQNKINALTDCLDKILEFKKLINNLSSAINCIENLFNEYQAKLAALNNDFDNDSNFSFSNTNTRELLNGISARGSLLLMLVECLFEKELATDFEMENLLDFKDAKGLVKMLSKKTKNPLSIEASEDLFAAHTRKIQKLKEFVLSKMVLVKKCEEFKCYLNNYLVNSNVIIFDQKHLECLREKEMQRLLFEFLRLRPELSVLKLSAIDLNEKGLIEVIASTMQLHSQFQSLQLSAGQEFTIDVLLQLEKSVQEKSENLYANLNDNLPLGPRALDESIGLLTQAYNVLVKKRTAQMSTKKETILEKDAESGHKMPSPLARRLTFFGSTPSFAKLGENDKNRKPGVIFK